MIFPSCMPGGINMVRQALGGFIDPPTISCLFHQVFSVPNCYSKDIRLHKLPININYKQKCNLNYAICITILTNAL